MSRPDRGPDQGHPDQGKERTLRGVLRGLRSAAVVPVSSNTGATDRRARTIARMEALQALGRAERAAPLRRFRSALIMLAALLPAAASAAWLIQAERPGGAEEKPGSGTPLARPRDAGERGPSPSAQALPDVGEGSPSPGAGEGSAAPPVAEERPAPLRPLKVAPGQGSAAGPRSTPRGVGAPSRSGAEVGSTLSEENALLQDAMAARRRGQAAHAVERLDGLLRRFPGSPLRTSAEVERFRALSQAGRKDEAVRAARRYLASHPEGAASEEARGLALARVSDHPPGARPRAPEQKP